MVDYKPNPENPPTHEELDLEDILNKSVNILDDFKVAEINPRVIDALHSHSKYTDDKGVVRYKTDFSDKSKEELDKIANSIFDALVYHSHLLHYEGISTERLEELKAIKDRHGNLYVDNVVQSMFGISREAIKKFVFNNRKNLTDEGLLRTLEDPIKNYIGRIQGPLFSKIESKHLGYVKDFVAHKKLKHKLPDDDYDLSGIHEAGDELYKMLGDMASKIYSRKKKD